MKYDEYNLYAIGRLGDASRMNENPSAFRRELPAELREGRHGEADRSANEEDRWVFQVGEREATVRAARPACNTQVKY